MTYKELASFCVPGNEATAEPFTDGAAWYATCGRIIVRTDPYMDKPLRFSAKSKLVAQWNWRFPKEPWLRIRPMVEGVVYNKCLECGGFGSLVVEEDGTRAVPCSDCYATGMTAPSDVESIHHCGARFLRVLLHKIDTRVRNAQLFAGKRDPGEPWPFIFTGGKGFVMPMRPAESTNEGTIVT